jgi:hypothetical protein
VSATKTDTTGVAVTSPTTDDCGQIPEQDSAGGARFRQKYLRANARPEPDLSGADRERWTWLRKQACLFYST